MTDRGPVSQAGLGENDFLDASTYKDKGQDKPSRISIGSRDSGGSGRPGGGGMGRSQSTPRSQIRQLPFPDISSGLICTLSSLS